MRTHLVQDTSLYDLASDRSHENTEPMQNINYIFILGCSFEPFALSPEHITIPIHSQLTS